MKEKLNVLWFSAGMDSFAAGYLEKDNIDRIVYIHIDDQHEDTLRFLKDCEKIYRKEIEIIQHPIYKTKNHVQRAFKFINSAYGAKCTGKLKKEVRKIWEQENKEYDFVYYWGFDIEEKDRAYGENGIVNKAPHAEHKFPLLERDMSKQDCHGLARKLGLKRPKMYDLGYPNNNCIGCVKGGMWYWNKIRVDFPKEFKEQAELEREIGATCLKETLIVDGEKVTRRIYLDELDPNRGRQEEEINEDCSIFCELAYRESED